MQIEFLISWEQRKSPSETERLLSCGDGRNRKPNLCFAIIQKY
jgi:hypothetical protein